MKSTGEVMGHASHFGHAFAKAQIAAGTPLPLSGAALITVNDFDKGAALKIGRDLYRLGFELFATSGTAAWLARAGLPVTVVKKVSEGHPNVEDLVEQGALQLVLNTPLGAPASRITSASSVALAGVSSDGLTTTALPQARAGATFHVSSKSGRFQGVTMPTTPMGFRTA
jgi:carbamoyl-phosphate synthase large subunit